MNPARRQYRPEVISASTGLKEQEPPYTEQRSRYARPRHETSHKWRAACQVAWRFRELFYPHKWVPLHRLRLQACRLYKAGWQPEELWQALHEASTRARKVPQTLWFFIGWMKRIRAAHEQRHVVSPRPARDWAPTGKRAISYVAELEHRATWRPVHDVGALLAGAW